MNREELAKMPGHQLVAHAREELLLTKVALAKILGIDEATVWRWEKDPEASPEGARRITPIARRVLLWMLEPGRPSDWPLPPTRKGGAS